MIIKNKFLSIVFKIAVLLFCHIQAGVSQNYIKTEILLDSVNGSSITDYQYFDGLGRKSLSSSTGISSDGKYVYSLLSYDFHSRISTEYLPIPGASYSEVLNANDFNLRANTLYNTSMACKNIYYNELGKPIKIVEPGQVWRDSEKWNSISYDVNITSDSVKMYSVSLTNNSLSWDYTYFPPGSLTIEEHIDEDGKRCQIFKDILDLIILERHFSDQEKYDTYYVYNDKAQLCYILTPEYQKHGYKDLYAYEYRYDSKGLVQKKIQPHCNYEQNYYDKDGRVIYQRNALGLYRFFLYDTNGRQVIYGTCSNYSYSHYKDVYMCEGNGFQGTGYFFQFSNALTSAHPDEITYYDDYQFLTKTLFTNSPYYSTLLKNNPGNVQGLKTGSAKRISQNRYLLNVFYYDHMGRVIDIRETLENGGIKQTTWLYDFTSNPLKETIVVTKNGLTHKIEKFYTYYTTNNKLATLSISYNDSTPVLIAEYTYDDIGRIKKIIRNGNSTNSVVYDYNLRGWKTKIESTAYKEWLYYTDGKGVPCFSGNISSQLWQVAGENFKRGYTFSYDQLGRMKDAIYGEGDNMNEHSNRYTERVKEYTMNGGIRKLERFGRKSDGKYGKIDNLRYYYSGMQLDSIKEDALPVTYVGAFDFKSNTIRTDSNQYSYYPNGSLKWDANKGVTLIKYDKFNHISKVQFHNGNCINYTYTLTGEKLSAIYQTAVPNISVPIGHNYSLAANELLSIDTIQYVGDFVFENGRLSKYLFEGGFISFTNHLPSYHYYTCDHLGNIRAVVDENGIAEQINHYYPYGAIYSDAGKNDAMQRYKYNGKELDRMHGLNLYDYGVRMYDPILGRFMNLDPMYENNYHETPYSYCSNNPINAIDNNGEFTIFVNGFHLNPFSNLDDYWGDFGNQFKKHFNDYNCKYYDGSISGALGLYGSAGKLGMHYHYTNLSASNRYSQGYYNGKKDASGIINSLKRDKDGRIIEILRIVSHSMGGAYAKGIAQAIMEYARNHPEETNGLQIVEYDFAPFEPWSQKAIDGVDTYQYSHSNDFIAFDSSINGAKHMKTENTGNILSSHFISSFIQYISQLPEGTYKIEDGKIKKIQ